MSGYFGEHNHWVTVPELKPKFTRADAGAEAAAVLVDRKAVGAAVEAVEAAEAALGRQEAEVIEARRMLTNAKEVLIPIIKKSGGRRYKSKRHKRTSKRHKRTSKRHKRTSKRHKK
jgi:hypothetical protein